MIETGKKLYDIKGHEVLIQSISGDTLNTIVTRYSVVSHNNGKESQVHTFKDRRAFSVSDIGILLFYKKEDISKETAAICKISQYKFNADGIQKSHNSKFNKIHNEIKLDAPLQTMTPKERAAIIASYYSDEKSLKEEETFYKSERYEYFGRIDLDTEFYRKYYEKYLKDHYYDKVYIGKSPYHNRDNIHIVDWRAPIATLFYDNEKTNLRVLIILL